MDIRQLRYFAAIVEKGSFSRAAEFLRVAQPALSLHVRNMEADLGTSLLIRTPRGVEPTEAGAILLRHAHTILDQLAVARDEVRGHGNDPAGEVRLGLPGTIGEILAVPLITAVHRRYPRIRLRIAEAMSGFVLDWMREGRIDLGVLYNPAAEHRIITEALLEERLVFFGPAAGGGTGSDGTGGDGAGGGTGGAAAGDRRAGDVAPGHAAGRGAALEDGASGAAPGGAAAVQGGALCGGDAAGGNGTGSEAGTLPPPGTPLRLAEVLRQPLILPGEGHGLRALIARHAAAAGIPLDTVIDVDSYGNIKALVAQGMGWSVLPANAVARELRAGALAGWPIAEPPLSRTVHLAYPADRPVTGAVAAVLNQARETLRELARSGRWAGASVLSAPADDG